MEKILVSACLLGEAVRYDGNSKYYDCPYLASWQQQGRLVSICPEVAGGLPVPRPAAEVVNREPVQVITICGTDVSGEFELGANKALALCKEHNIRFALLKERSPSCGSRTNYDGTFSGNQVAQPGITSALLQSHGVQVFSEETIEQLATLIEE